MKIQTTQNQAGIISGTLLGHSGIRVFQSFTVIISGLLLSLFSISLFAQGVLTEDDVFSDIPVVTGASHFPQKISDAPTAVSIIDRQMIDASGAIEIVDLFRMIPGFQVYFPHAGRHAINYHGFPQEYSYRMEVKIDGHSVYEPAENAVLWPTLPIELDDIEYIEVIRGANAPADGANATIASVNIVTRTPVASEGWRLRSAIGDWDNRNLSFAYSGLEGSTTYKLNGGYRYSSGFPDNEDYKFDDDVESSYLNFRSIFTPTLFDSVDLQMGYSENNIDMSDSGFSLSVSDITKWNYDTYYLFTNWEHQLNSQDSFQLLFYHNYADIDAPELQGLFSDFLGVSPAMVPILFPGLDDFEIIFGLYDSFSERSDLEFRYKGTLSTSTRYMWGVATRYDVMRSKAQFPKAVEVEESSHRIFSNLESKPSENWVFNLGAIYEYNKVVDGYSSYRVSANYHFHPGHTLRLSYNDGERSPGLFESNQQAITERSGYLLDIDTIAPDNLATEKFESQEVGYYGMLFDNTLTVEVKLFEEKNRDLVKYTVLDTPLDLNGTYTERTNSAWADVEGIETQLKYQPDNNWLINFQYTYLNQKGRWLRRMKDDGSTRYKDSAEEVPAETGSLMTAYFFNSGFETSMLLYYQGEVDWQQGDFSDDYFRTDIRIAQRMQLSNGELLVEVIGQNIFDEDYTEFHRLNQHESRFLLRAVLNF